MILTTEKYSGNREAAVARFTDMTDLVNTHRNSAYVDAHDVPDNWAGGNLRTFYDTALRGDERYARRAEKYVDRFANVAIQDYALDLEYNPNFGVLDYNAAYAGEPNCMYGPTYVETDRAPVGIYVNMWISSTVKPHLIERRGIAVLALVQALTLFRPVRCHAVLAHTGPERQDQIMMMPIPTAPMNLSVASWMLASPLFPRRGLYGIAHEIAKSHKAYAGFAISAGQDWMRTQLGNYCMELEGMGDTVYLPQMFGYGDEPEWATDEGCIKWIEAQLERFI